MVVDLVAETGLSDWDHAFALAVTGPFPLVSSRIVTTSSKFGLCRSNGIQLVTRIVFRAL
jgi:hypothetical protein